MSKRLLDNKIQADSSPTLSPSLFVWLVADGWCCFVQEKYRWLVADG
jgi:hypothetical protein